MDGNTQRAERRVRHWGARASGRIVADCLAWCIAVTFVSILRVDFDLGQLWLHGQLLILPAAIASHLLAAWMTGLYVGRWRVGSFDEVAALARTIAIATALLASIDALSGNPRLVPLAAPIGGGIVAFVLTGAVRYVIRVRYERARRPTAASAARVLVFGAGVGGEQVITAMLRDPTSPYIPVVLLDDDPARAAPEHHGRPGRRHPPRRRTCRASARRVDAADRDPARRPCTRHRVDGLRARRRPHREGAAVEP